MGGKWRVRSIALLLAAAILLTGCLTGCHSRRLLWYEKPALDWTRQDLAMAEEYFAWRAEREK